MMTARLRLLAAGCLVMSVVLTGCESVIQGEPSAGASNGGPGSAPYEHPTGGEDVLVSIDSAGAYGPLEFELDGTAEFLLLGDATAIARGAVAETNPGPAIHPLRSARLTEDQIQELLMAAEDAGLLEGKIDYGRPGISDLDTTTVQIAVVGQTVSQSAYGLGSETEGPPLTDAERVARRGLQVFIDTAHALVGVDSEQYVPTGVVAYRLGAEASVDQPDLEQEPVPWPITTVPPSTTATDPDTCIAVTGADVPTLLAALERANRRTPWLIGTEPPTRMVFRPLLPGDPGCER